MEKEFIPYEQALELKELGFDEPCFGWFRTTLLPSNFTEYFLETELGLNEEFTDLINSNFTGDACSAPLYQQSFRWFREKCGLFSSEVYDRGLDNGKLPIIHSYSFRILNLNNFEDFYGDTFNTPEEAELECLKQLIQIIKNK